MGASEKLAAAMHGANGGAPEASPLSRVSAYLEQKAQRAAVSSGVDPERIHGFGTHSGTIDLVASDVQAIVDELVLTRARVVSALDLAELADLAAETFELAEGDSNDDEIEALQGFRDAALAALKIAVTHE